MESYIYSLVAVVIVSLISLIGISSLLLKKNLLDKAVLLLVSLAAGTLIGDVFFHIIPELYHEAELEGENIISQIPLYILSGIIVFFIIEKLVHWRHCHVKSTKVHPHPIAVTNIIGDGLHNFIDGIVIAASFQISLPIGIATTIAVIAHEIPQEIGDFGVLVHAGMSKLRAILLNFGSALLAILGVILTFLVGGFFEQTSLILLGFAAGGFLYIAIADLIPEIKHENNWKKSILQLVFVIVGLVIMYGLTFLEVH